MSGEQNSLSESTHVSSHTNCSLFPTNRHFLHYSSSLWEFFLAKLKGQSHWPRGQDSALSLPQSHLSLWTGSETLHQVSTGLVYLRSSQAKIILLIDSSKCFGNDCLQCSLLPIILHIVEDKSSENANLIMSNATMSSGCP